MPVDQPVKLAALAAAGQVIAYLLSAMIVTQPSQTGRSPPRTATSGSRQRPGVFDSFT
jgi:hypothetical protein